MLRTLIFEDGWLRFLLFNAELHECLVLSESEILQVIWIAHVKAFDLEVTFIPFAVLLRLDRALQELLELPRSRLIDTLHQERRCAFFN